MERTILAVNTSSLSFGKQRRFTSKMVINQNYFQNITLNTLIKFSTGKKKEEYRPIKENYYKIVLT